jgi:hypothetical protein
MVFNLIQLTTLEFLSVYLHQYTGKKWRFSQRNKQRIIDFLEKGGKRDPKPQDIRKLAGALAQVWNHRGQHAKGFVMSLRTVPKLILRFRLSFPKPR